MDRVLQDFGAWPPPPLCNALVVNGLQVADRGNDNERPLSCEIKGLDIL